VWTVSFIDNKSPEEILWFGNQIYQGQNFELYEIMSDKTEMRVGSFYNGEIIWDDDYKGGIDA